jgi:nucleotide-binding universal stress UspA family protein
MYERILVPTDGSALSVAAALHAVSLATKMGSRLLALQVIAPYQFPVYLEYAPTNLITEQEYIAQCQQAADLHLAMLSKQAAEADVECTGKAVFHGNTAQSIVDAAAQESCELIVMGSHGRSGLSRMFLGSVTGKVLALSHTPVLVHRATEPELAAAANLMRASRDVNEI